MAFKVKARVLLELGGELISSDAIALYELIKNAIDAGSPKIALRVVVALTTSGYQALRGELDRLAESRVPAALIRAGASRWFEPSTPIPMRDKLAELLCDAPIETARENLRLFFVDNTYIEIEDWGHGMSRDDLEEKFLTIGTLHRALQRSVATEQGSRSVLGEKGIGRLSVMRLGNTLELQTKRAGAKRSAELSIDWAGISEDLNLDLDRFPVQARDGNWERAAQTQGTLIRIADLRSDWSQDRLTNISRAELSKLQDPFDRGASRLDLRVDYNGNPVDPIQQIDPTWLKKSHGYFEISFDYVVVEGHREPRLTGLVWFRVPSKDGKLGEREVDEKKINAVGSQAYGLLGEAGLTKGGTENTSVRYPGIDTLGPFKAQGYWFNRQRIKKELKHEYPEFEHWLKQWGGGLLMFRDGFRVYPYAEPDDDWLELDQKALRRKSFKLNRGQFVGRVEISASGNRFLVDQTNRQGLCDSPEKRRLVKCLQFVIWDELGSLVKKYELKSAKSALNSVKEIDRHVKECARDARSQLRELAQRAPQESSVLQQLKSYVDELELAWSKAKSTIKQQQVQADVYLHLAGVGMLLEFVIHELSRVTRSTLSDLGKVRSADLSPTLKSLSLQLKTLEKRLRILDPVSTPGRQRRQPVNITEVIQTLLDAHEEQFERHKIRIIWEHGSEKIALNAIVVPGQMYQIFENLVSNSVYWLGHQRAVLTETRGSRQQYTPRIAINVNSERREVRFTDNGPGIDPADRKKIFQPFFSKKPDGRGVGLYIVSTLCTDNKIGLSLLDEDERGVHPGFRFVFP